MGKGTSIIYLKSGKSQYLVVNVRFAFLATDIVPMLDDVFMNNLTLLGWGTQEIIGRNE